MGDRHCVPIPPEAWETVVNHNPAIRRLSFQGSDELLKIIDRAGFLHELPE